MELLLLVAFNQILSHLLIGLTSIDVHHILTPSSGVSYDFVLWCMLFLGWTQLMKIVDSFLLMDS